MINSIPVVMQELSITDVSEVSGGLPGLLDISSAFGHLGRAFSFGYAVGTGFMYLMENSYMGRGEFPSAPRAGHE